MIFTVYLHQPGKAPRWRHPTRVFKRPSAVTNYIDREMRVEFRWQRGGPFGPPAITIAVNPLPNKFVRTHTGAEWIEQDLAAEYRRQMKRESNYRAYQNLKRKDGE